LSSEGREFKRGKKGGGGTGPQREAQMVTTKREEAFDRKRGKRKLGDALGK